MKRSELKEIIKECLVEILSEGIGQGALLESKVKQPVRKQPIVDHARIREDGASSVRKQVSESLTSNPVMQDIFQDTMKTTLLEQSSAQDPERFKSMSASQLMGGMTESYDSDYHVEKEPAFDPSKASKWELLAFSSPRGK